MLVASQFTAFANEDIIITVTPKYNPMPPQAALYFDRPGQYFNVSLTNTNMDASKSVFLGLTFTLPASGSQEGGRLATSQQFTPSRCVTVGAGQTIVLGETQLNDLFGQYGMLNLAQEGCFSKIFEGQKNGSSGLLPEGTYTMWLQAFDFPAQGGAYSIASNPSSGRCNFDIWYMASAPKFEAPSANTIALGSMAAEMSSDEGAVKFPVTYPHFSWTIPAVHGMAGTMGTYMYDFKINYMAENQSVEDAASGAVAFQQLGLMSNFIDVPAAAVQMIQKSGYKKFVASVTARSIYNDASQTTYKAVDNNGRSELLFLKLADSDIITPGGGTGGDNTVDGKTNTGITVTVEPKFDVMPGDMTNYFKKPSSLFTVTVNNGTNVDEKIALMLQYYANKWGVTPATSFQHTDRFITVPANTIYTLTDIELDNLAGEYDMKNVVEFNPHTGVIRGTVAETKFTIPKDTVYARVVRYSGLGKPVSRETTIAKGRNEFYPDASVESGDIVKIDIKQKLEKLPTLSTTYIDMPERLYEISLKNLSKKEIKVRLLALFAKKDASSTAKAGEVYGFRGYSKEKDDKFVTIPASSTVVLSDAQAHEMFGGFEEVTEYIKGEENAVAYSRSKFYGDYSIKDGDEFGIGIAAYDYDSYKTRQEALENGQISVEELENSTIGKANSYNTTSSDVLIMPVDITIKQKLEAIPTDINSYLDKPERLYELTLKNTTDKDIKARIYLSFGKKDFKKIAKEGDVINFGAPYEDEAQTINIPANSSIEVNGAELKRLCAVSGDVLAITPEAQYIYTRSELSENVSFEDKDEIGVRVYIIDDDLYTKMEQDEDGNRHINTAIVGVNRSYNTASKDAILNDVDISIKQKLEKVPTDVSLYLDNPGAMYELTLTNTTDKTIKASMLLAFGVKGAFDKGKYGFYGEDDREELFELLPGEPKVLSGVDINKICGLYQNVKVYDRTEIKEAIEKDKLSEFVTFENGDTVSLLVRIFDSEVLTETKDYMRARVGVGRSENEASDDVNLDPVQIKIKQKLEALPTDPTLYLDKPSSLYEVTLVNTTKEKKNILLAMAIGPKDNVTKGKNIFNGDLSEKNDKTIELDAEETKTLTYKEFQELCGGFIKANVISPEHVNQIIEKAELYDYIDIEHEEEVGISLSAYDKDVLKTIKEDENAKLALLGKAKSYNKASKTASLQDILVEIKQKYDSIPCETKYYLEKPQALYEISLTNTTEEAVKARMTFFFGQKGATKDGKYIFYGDPEEKKGKTFVLQPGEKKNFEGSEIKDLNSGYEKVIINGNEGYVANPEASKLPDYVTFADGDSVGIAVQVYDLEVLENLKENESIQKAKIGLGRSYNRASENFRFSDFELIVNTIQTKCPEKLSDYVDKPGEIFEMSIVSEKTTAQDLSLEMWFNDSLFVPTAKLGRTINVAPKDTTKLSEEQINELLGGFTAKDVKQMDKKTKSVFDTSFPELIGGKNKVSVYLVDASSTSKVDTLAVDTCIFSTSSWDVKIGEFTLTIQDFKKLEADSCYAGTGYVTWHPFGSDFPLPIDCTFDSIWINDENVVYKGDVKSSKDKEEDFIPYEWLDDVSGMKTEQYGNKLKDALKGSEYANYYKYVQDVLKVSKDIYNLVNNEKIEPVTLPLAMPEELVSADKCPVDIQLLSMQWTPDEAWMNIMGEFILPESDYYASAENMLVLGAPKLSISETTFLPESGKIALLADFTVKDPSSGFDITFKGPTDRDKVEDGCFVAWEKGGFGGFSIDAKMSIPDLIKATEEGKATEEKPTIELIAYIENKHDWYGQIKMDPFQHEDAPGYTFIPTGTEGGITYDHSQKKSPKLNLPDGYDPAKAGFKDMKPNDVESQKPWQGFYFEHLALRFPDYVKLSNKKKSDNENVEEVSNNGLAVGIKDMMIDDSGFSAMFYGQNILDYETGNCGGWAFSLDELSVRIVQNDFKKFNMNGTFDVPLLDGKIGYEANVERVDKADGKKTTRVIFETRQIDDLSLDFFLATAEFDKEQTYFNITSMDDTTKVELCIGGELSINGTDDLDLPANFSIPGVKFYNMRVANFCNKTKEELEQEQKDREDKKEKSWDEYIKEFTTDGVNLYQFQNEDGTFCFDLGRWKLASPKKKLGPFEFELSDFDVVNENDLVGLKIGGKVGVMEKVTAGTAISIWAKVDIGNMDIDYKETRFEKASLACNFGGLKMEGELEAKRTETTKGYCGSLNLEMPGNLFNLKIVGGYFTETKTDADFAKDKAKKGYNSMSAADQKKFEASVDSTYAWGYFIAAVEGKAGIPIPPIQINGISGGFYFNCTPAGSEDKPAASYMTFGGKFGLAISTTGSDNLINCKGSMTVVYDAGAGRLSCFRLDGEVHALCGTDKDKGLVNSDITLIYACTSNDKGEIEDKYLDLNITIDAGADMSDIYKDFTGQDLSELTSAIGDLTGMGADNDTNKSTETSEEDKSDSPIGGSMGKVKINFNLKVTWYEKGEKYNPVKWHIYLGEPDLDKRCSIVLIDYQIGKKSDPIAVWAKVWANGYVCLGNELPNDGELPALPDEVKKFLDGDDVNGDKQSLSASADAERQAATKEFSKFTGGKNYSGGIMFGVSAGGEFGLNAAIAYVNASLLGGFDICLKKLKDGTRCMGSGKTAGKNGYYGTGQVYALAKGEIGLMFNMWIFSGKIPLIDVGLGALLQGGFPNPSWVYGKVRAKGSLLNGLIKFNKAVELKAGEVCMPEFGNPLDDIEIFGDFDPGYEDRENGWNKDNAVSVYTKPKFTTNMSMDRTIRLLDERARYEMAGYDEDLSIYNSNAERTYIFHLEPSGKLEVYNEFKEGDEDKASLLLSRGVSFEANGSREKFNVVTGTLEPMTNYAITVSGYAKQVVDGKEVDPIFNDSTTNYKDVNKPWSQSITRYFRTADIPEDMVQDMKLARPYPGGEAIYIYDEAAGSRMYFAEPPARYNNYYGMVYDRSKDHDRLTRQEAMAPYFSLQHSYAHKYIGKKVYGKITKWSDKTKSYITPNATLIPIGLQATGIANQGETILFPEGYLDWKAEQHNTTTINENGPVLNSSTIGLGVGSSSAIKRWAYDQDEEYAWPVKQYKGRMSMATEPTQQILTKTITYSAVAKKAATNAASQETIAKNAATAAAAASKSTVADSLVIVASNAATKAKEYAEAAKTASDKDTSSSASTTLSYYKAAATSATNAETYAANAAKSAAALKTRTSALSGFTAVSKNSDTSSSSTTISVTNTSSSVSSLPSFDSKSVANFTLADSSDDESSVTKLASKTTSTSSTATSSSTGSTLSKSELSLGKASTTTTGTTTTTTGMTLSGSLSGTTASTTSNTSSSKNDLGHLSSSSSSLSGSLSGTSSSTLKSPQELEYENFAVPASWGSKYDTLYAQVLTDGNDFVLEYAEDTSEDGYIIWKPANNKQFPAVEGISDKDSFMFTLYCVDEDKKNRYVQNITEKYKNVLESIKSGEAGSKDQKSQYTDVVDDGNDDQPSDFDVIDLRSQMEQYFNSALDSLSLDELETKMTEFDKKIDEDQFTTHIFFSNFYLRDEVIDFNSMSEYAHYVIEDVTFDNRPNLKTEGTSVSYTDDGLKNFYNYLAYWANKGMVALRTFHKSDYITTQINSADGAKYNFGSYTGSGAYRTYKTVYGYDGNFGQTPQHFKSAVIPSKPSINSSMNEYYPDYIMTGYWQKLSISNARDAAIQLSGALNKAKTLFDEYMAGSSKKGGFYELYRDTYYKMDNVSFPYYQIPFIYSLKVNGANSLDTNKYLTQSDATRSWNLMGTSNSFSTSNVGAYKVKQTWVRYSGYNNKTGHFDVRPSTRSTNVITKTNSYTGYSYSY